MFAGIPSFPQNRKNNAVPSTTLIISILSICSVMMLLLCNLVNIWEIECNAVAATHKTTNMDVNPALSKGEEKAIACCRYSCTKTSASENAIYLKHRIYNIGNIIPPRDLSATLSISAAPATLIMSTRGSIQSRGA